MLVAPHCMPYTTLTTQSELPPTNEVKEFPCGDKMICVANVDGKISALDNVCLHHGGPLGQGVIQKGKVICPWHGWAYDAQTGALESNPTVKVAVYPIKVEEGQVLVDI